MVGHSADKMATHFCYNGKDKILSFILAITKLPIANSEQVLEIDILLLTTFILNETNTSS